MVQKAIEVEKREEEIPSNSSHSVCGGIFSFPSSCIINSNNRHEQLSFPFSIRKNRAKERDTSFHGPRGSKLGFSLLFLLLRHPISTLFLIIFSLQFLNVRKKFWRGIRMSVQGKSYLTHSGQDYFFSSSFPILRSWKKFSASSQRVKLKVNWNWLIHSIYTRKQLFFFSSPSESRFSSSLLFQFTLHHFSRAMSVYNTAAIPIQTSSHCTIHSCSLSSHIELTELHNSEGMNRKAGGGWRRTSASHPNEWLIAELSFLLSCSFTSKFRKKKEYKKRWKRMKKMMKRWKGVVVKGEDVCL